MIPPSEADVFEYIKNKKGWPDEFCRHMAEKFWNFYESKGWLVGRVKMKSWQAAFNSQWQQLREEDVKILERHKFKEEPKIMNQDSEVYKLDQLLLQYKAKFESVSNDDLLQWYEFLLLNKLRCTITNLDIDLIKQAYGDNKDKCRAAIVRMTFDWYINNGYTFSQRLANRTV